LWVPPKRLPLADWAEQNFVLSKYAPVQGLIRLHAFQREPFDAFTDPRVSTIVLKVGTQMIKTVLIQAAIAYAICEMPGPILIGQPTDTDAGTFSKERLGPMIADMPALRAKISPAKSRDASNALTYKDFPGGTLNIVGAGTPGNAARRTIQYLMMDEVNKYRATSEGNFTDLAEERTAPYRSRAKRVYACSPTDPKGLISRKYELSDQRKPYVPCPACGYMQVLKWMQVRWDKTLPTELQALSAWYECEAEGCRAKWTDAQRRQAVDQTEWRASRPFRGIAGFWISHLYSPDKTLGKIVQAWLDAETTGDVDSLKVFINTNLAEDWVEKGASPEYERLLDRREDYLGTVPRGVLLVTAGADVHPDRIEVEIVGWGRRRESWSLDYLILDGRTSEPEVWQKLELLLGEVFLTDGGQELPIARLFIDSGHATNEVYSWVRSQGTSRVCAIKGEHRGMLPVGPPSPVDVTIGGRKIKNGLKIKTIQVSHFKEELYRDLDKRRPTDEELAAGATYPPGYCHFPKDGNYGDEHFKQLCSEQLVTSRDRKGRERREWQQTRPRNEALDCRIYARAAAWDLGMDRFKESQWAELEIRYADSLQVEPQEDTAAEAPAPMPEQTQPLLPGMAAPPAPVQVVTVSVASSRPRPVVSPAAIVAVRSNSWFGNRAGEGWLRR